MSTRKFVPKWLRLAGLGVFAFLFILALAIVPDAKGAFSRPFQSLFSLSGISKTASTAVPENIIFTAEFLPDTIGLGSVSTLRFVISNTDQTGTVSDLAFSNVLPAGVTIASPANAQVTCDSLIDAPDGGSTIGFSSARLGFNQSCTITVNVTSSTPGPHSAVSGDLISSAGNSGPAEADLEVVTDRPGFSQSFSPESVSYGSRSTVTFTVDNTANASLAFNLSFTDNLPLGMVVADPANAATTCESGIVTAVPGTDMIGLANGIVLAGSNCTVIVDVMGNAAGRLNNVTGELASWSNGTQSSGRASAALNVTADHMALVESFIDDPAAPGSKTTVEFTIHNLDRTRAAENIVFTNDLNAVLSGLTAVPPLPSNPCGSGSVLTGTGFLTLAGGSLPAEGSCTFTVTLQIPGTAVPGTYPNTTSPITADIDGHTVTGSPAAENLYVAELPSLTMTFLDSPVSDGSVTTVEFTITNNSSFAAANIAFTNNLDAFISGITGASLPSGGFCGPGSSLVIWASTEQNLILTGGSLAAGASCTFTAGLLIPTGTPPGIYTSQTDRITAVLDGQSVIGKSASADLEVVSAPDLGIAFTDDPLLPGGIVTLEFTLSYSENAGAAVTNVAFTDDLAAVLPGLTAVSLPPANICGPGSQISGTSLLTFSGGTLIPGSTCTFTVGVQLPVSVLPGSYTNTTSGLTGIVDGIAVTGTPARDDLQVAGLTFTQSFTDDPVIPGDTVILEYMIANTSEFDAADMTFTHDFNGMLTGLTAVGLPTADVCGVGSQIFGTTTLDFTGGHLLPGTSCTFRVTLQVPAGTASDSYNSLTSQLTASIEGNAVLLDPAADKLAVSSDWLLLSKSFTGAPVLPGDMVTLEYTVTNLDDSQSVLDIAFNDDLAATLPGLTAVNLPANDVCGTGSVVSGSSVLSLTGGSLAPGADCTFSVTLQVPEDAAFGSYSSTSDQATGLMGGLVVTSLPATAVLNVRALAFTKSFTGFAAPSGHVTLSYTIQNPDPIGSMSGIAFVDDLDAVVCGLTAENLPLNDVCGSGSVLAGTSLLSLTGADLKPGGSCTFNVTLRIPDTALPGSYPSSTSALMSNGLTLSGPATATLFINPRPTIYLPLAFNNATFAPDLVVTGLNLSGGNVEIIIENQGLTAVTDEFWVDVYINPHTPPVRVNQPWPDLAGEGLVWGVTAGALPLQPGDTLVLTMGDTYFVPEYSQFSGEIGPGTAVYAQVDSANANTTYGAVRETHEITGGVYNNIYKITTSVSSSLTSWARPTRVFGGLYQLPERPLSRLEE